MIWFTSDWHLGHARINDLAGRPFADVDSMNEWLIDNANRQTKPHDTIMFLGDAAMGQIADSLPLFKQVNVRSMVLKPGNHDRCSPLYSDRWTDWIGRYEDVGFEVTDNNWFSCNDFDAVLSHFPYEGDTHGEDRFSAARLPDKGEWLLHGHTHGQWRQNGRQIDVGVDAWGGQLVSVYTLATVIHAGPARLEALPWTL